MKCGRIAWVLLALLVALTGVYAALAPLGRRAARRAAHLSREHLHNRSAIADRVAEFGPAVRERLWPRFHAARVAYPPAEVVLVGLKHERRLEVYAAGVDHKLRRITAYPILGASGKLGPKLREGDCQVPEGLYRVESLNPKSRFHLALRVSYPNDHDRQRAAQEGRTELGGDIMIHGGTASTGCLAVGDRVAEDLFILAAEAGYENVRVVLSPVDFRQRKLPRTLDLPPWTASLYDQLTDELRRLPPR